MPATMRVGALSYDLTLEKGKYEAGMRAALNDAKTFSRQAGAAFGDAEKSATKSFEGIAGAYKDTGVRLARENDSFLRGSKTAFDGAAGHAKKSADSMHGSFKTAIAGMSGMFAAMGLSQAFSTAVGTVKDSIKAASDQEQAFGALDTVLGGLAPSVKEWAAQQYKIGLSTTEASSGVTYLTSMLTNNGLALDESVAKSETLTGLAADMAAAFGGTAKDAIDAISAALRGETDPIERYGVSMKEATLQAYALEHGLTTSKGPLDQVTKAQAAYGIMLQQTAKIQGQATREQNTYEGQLGKLKATWANTKAEMGKAFLPVVVQGLETLNGMMPALGQKVQEWMPKVQEWLGKVAQEVKDNWPAIKETVVTIADALQRVGDVAKIVFDIFMSLPPELRTMLVTGIIVNKATGGVPGSIIGGLAQKAIMGGGSSLLGLGGGGAAAAEGAGAAAAGSRLAAIGAGASRVAGPAAIAASAGGAAWNITRNSGKAADRADGSANEAGKLGLINAVDGATFGVFKLNKTLDESYDTIERNKQSIAESQKLSDKLRASGKDIPVNIDPASLNKSESVFVTWWHGVKQLFSGWGGTLVDTIAFTWREAMGGIDTWIQGIKDKVFGFVSGVASGVGGAITGALGGLWQSITDNFNRILGMITAVPKTIVGGVSGLAGDWLAGVKSIGKADGGYISGAGSSTSDSIPAWLSNGEYVLRASAVRRIGVATLDRANSGYANGGLVGTHDNSFGSTGAGLSIGQVTVVAQDMNSFERSVRAKQRAAVLGGRR